MIPLFLLVASLNHHYSDYIAAGIFLLAAVTDGLDGYLARKRNQITLLGQFLDPVADKILITAALIFLVEIGRIPGWIAIIIVSREIAVTGLRSIAAAQGTVIAASRLGKIKTVTQIVAITCALLNNYPLSLIANIGYDWYAMLIAIIITIYSGYEYLAKNVKLLKN
jgi:CDP-diacylglycerol--glycerol-3-phosphate 3-phosphatidyltransferase